MASGNTMAYHTIVKGDADTAMGTADVVVKAVMIGLAIAYPIVAHMAVSTRSVAVTAASLAVLERMLDGFNRHDLEAIMSLFVDDCVFESPRGPEPWGRRFVGREEVRAGLGARFQGIPDVHYGKESHFVSNDRGVSEWTLTGTTVDGEHLEVRGCDLWTFRGNEIVRKDSFWKIVER